MQTPERRVSTLNAQDKRAAYGGDIILMRTPK